MPDISQDDFNELKASVDYLQVRLSELDTLRSDVSLASEALQLAHDVIADLIDETSSDNSQFADDLERIDEIAHLIM